MQTIKTYSKRVPFYNAFIRQLGRWVVDLKNIVIPDLGVRSRGQITTLTRAACARHATKHDKS